MIKLVTLYNEENNEIKDDAKIVIFQLIINIDQSVISISKIKKNTICLNLIKNSYLQCFNRKSGSLTIFEGNDLRNEY